MPDFEAALTGEVKGLKIGIPKEYRPEGLAPEIEALWEKGIDLLKRAGADPGRDQPAAHQIRAAHLLHRRPGRGVLEPGALRRGALRPAQGRRDAWTRCTPIPAPPVSAPRCGAAS